MKNYKIMDRESQKEALKGNLALKYRIRCIKHIYLGSYQRLAYTYVYLYLQNTSSKGWKEYRMENSLIFFLHSGVLCSVQDERLIGRTEVAKNYCKIYFWKLSIHSHPSHHPHPTVQLSSPLSFTRFIKCLYAVRDYPRLHTIALNDKKVLP